MSETNLNPNQVDGKANLSGGNSFSGTQHIYQGEGVDYAITFSKAGVTGTSGFTVGANGVVLSAPSNNLDINNRTVFKNITTLGNIAGTTQSLSAFTVEGCYTANLNGTATIKLPTPTSTQAMKENTINILLNITGDSNIIWQDTNSNGINANNCMTTFAVGKYLIKLRYDNSSSQWIGEILKGESVASTTKAYFSFNDEYADETGSTTLTPYSGYTPVFSSEYTAFSGRKSLQVGNNVNTNYFIPSGFNNIILSGPFNIRFWVQKDTIGHNALTILNYVSAGGTSYNLLEIFDTYFKFKAATDAQASTIQNVLYPQDLSLVLTNKMHYIEVSRDSNNTVRLFIDGVVKGSSSYSNDIYLPANEALFSSQMWYIQDFAIENQVGHISDYDVPTTPYSISEQSLPDYHDPTAATKTELATKQSTLNASQLSAVNSGIDTTKVGQIATNTSNITTINGKIPAAASPSNQLADKEFVNSSVATNTAYFKGTFSSVAALLAYSGDITNNDYAFVTNSVIQDNGNDWSSATDLNNYNKASLTNKDYAWVVNGSNFDLYVFDIVNQQWVLTAANTSKITQPTAYNRYKAIVSDNTVTWSWEYTLNNSSFTAAQWGAINSGITAALVSLIATALQSVPYATASRVGGIRIEKDTVNGIINIIDED